MASDTARASTPLPPGLPGASEASPSSLDKYKERFRQTCHDASVTLQEFLQDMFDFAVQLCGAFMAAVLAHPDVQEAAAQIMVRGMNGFVTQPDLNDTMKIMSDTMARGQEDFARSAGADFPKLAGKFFEGMMSRKDKDKNKGKDKDKNKDEDKDDKKSKEAIEKDQKKDNDNTSQKQLKEEENTNGPVRKDTSDSNTFASFFQSSNHQKQSKKDKEQQHAVDTVDNVTTNLSVNSGSGSFGSPLSQENPSSNRSSPNQQSQSAEDVRDSPSAKADATLDDSNEKANKKDDKDRGRSVSPMMRPFWVSNSPFRRPQTPVPPQPSASSSNPKLPPASATDTPKTSSGVQETASSDKNNNDNTDNSHPGSTSTTTDSTKRPSPANSTSKPPPQQHHEPLGGLFKSLTPRPTSQQPPPPQPSSPLTDVLEEDNPILMPTLSLTHTQDDTTIRQELQNHNP